MNFCNQDYVREILQDKIIAIVGSGPGSLSNKMGFVDSHEVVIRINNYKTMLGTGRRTDVFYSFFGKSIRKKASDLKRDGVQLCMAKCPDSKILESKWHKDNSMENGVDFRAIYENREKWWFCETYVPSTSEFIDNFNLLDGHIPTTGFSALLDVLRYNPAHVYLTGFDFFESKIHNLTERWDKPSRLDDPIGHTPLKEAEWINENRDKIPVSFDKRMEQTIRKICEKN